MAMSVPVRGYWWNPRYHCLSSHLQPFLRLLGSNALVDLIILLEIPTPTAFSGHSML